MTSPVKVLPIKSCKECPYLLNESELKGCDLSDTRCYDVESDWEGYLEQYCPLYYLETIIDDAYEMGMNHSKSKKDTMRKVSNSTRQSTEDKWYTAHEFLERIEQLKEE